MLVNSEFKFDKGDVLALKNILGEEIICEFISETPTHYTINKPFAMAMTQQGAAFAPPIHFGDIDREFEIDKSHLLWATVGNKEVTAAYRQQVSGIMVPEKNNKIIT